VNKIIEALLKAKYPTIDTTALLTVINATPNAEIATEILCGLYVRPEINAHPKTGFSTEKVNIAFKSFDDLTQEVEYTYNRVETKTVWIVKGSEMPKFTDTNLVTAYWAEDAAKKIGITEKELKEQYVKVVLQGEPSEQTYTDKTLLTNWQ